MPRKNVIRSILVCAWGAVALFCFLAIMPSIGRDPTYYQGLITNWPESSEIERRDLSPHLLVFVHPYCPCTRASLKNLKDHVQSKRLNVTVVQLRSTRFDGIYSPISAIEEVIRERDWNLVFDTDGVEARKFGVVTSGECLLFAPSGELVFSGGVTALRGHSGTNKSLSTLIAHIDALEANTTPSLVKLIPKNQMIKEFEKFPTFGCPLFCEDMCR